MGKNDLSPSWTFRRASQAGETFRRFTACINWARGGKTFIYMHPDFVAIDQKTWKQIQDELHPPIPRQIIYDEYDEWTPEMEKRLKKIMADRLTKPISRENKHNG